MTPRSIEHLYCRTAAIPFKGPNLSGSGILPQKQAISGGSFKSFGNFVKLDRLWRAGIEPVHRTSHFPMADFIMSDPQVSGKIHLIEETKTYGQKGFRKRLLVLEQDKGRFTNYIPVEFTNDNCDRVDDLKVGQDVLVNYRLSGRRWQRDPSSEVKFFVNVEALSVTVQAEPGPAGEAGKNAEDFNQANAELKYSEDDIPF